MVLRNLILVFVFLPFLVEAQRWEFGLAGGGTAYAGDLTPEGYDLQRIRPAGGILIRRHFSPNFGIRLNTMYGQLSGDESRYSQPTWRKARAFKFTTGFQEAALLFEWDILGKKRFKDRKLKHFPGPYLTVGGAMNFFKPKTNFNDQGEPNPVKEEDKIAADKNADFGSPCPTLIVGGGLKMYTGRHWTLGLEGGVHSTDTDYLDGVSKSGMPGNRDWFIYAGLTLSYRILYKDTDRDGIPNRYDLCPVTPGTRLLKGCPDEDEDGITDADDRCPHEAGKLSAQGCPDADNDGIRDTLDQCPNAAGSIELAGCPDRDGDLTPDHLDLCPDTVGLKTLAGCPDMDGDSIPDYLDKCPTEGGKVNKYGCPFIDTDGDDVADEIDRCPQVKGLPALDGCPDADTDGLADDEDACPQAAGPVALKGCPDTDADGVADKDDRCPNLAGTTANKGCPEIKKEDKEAIELAVRSIDFENKSHQLKAVSIPVLDKIAEILLRYPNYQVAIQGHTDNVGSDKSNLVLSARRAKRCQDYLITKGIRPERLTFKGFGESKPIAPNTTAQGRQKNRRVEFILRAN